MQAHYRARGGEWAQSADWPYIYVCRTLFQAQIIRALHPVNLYLERQTTQSFSECSVPACFLKIPFCGNVLCLKSFIQAVVGWMSTTASERQGTVLCLYSFSTIYFRHFRSLLLQMPFNPLICRMDNLCRVSFYTSFSLVLILTFQDREPSAVLNHLAEIRLPSFTALSPFTHSNEQRGWFWTLISIIFYIFSKLFCRFRKHRKRDACLNRILTKKHTNRLDFSPVCVLS